MIDIIKKGDFIELEFTARIKDGEVFDTNIESEAKKLNSDIKPKPLIVSVGHALLIKGLDKELEGKQIGKQYEQEFPPEEAFGKRNPQLIKMYPLSQFTAQNINPLRGMQLSLDNQIAHILSSSGGRVLVDFNNPLAGKIVVYKFKPKRKLTSQNEKINALQDFFFKKQFKFKTDKTKKTITFQIPEKQKQLVQFIELLAKPFDEILGMTIASEITKDNPDNKKK